jgi:hypothetical protein
MHSKKLIRSIIEMNLSANLGIKGYNDVNERLQRGEPSRHERQHLEEA